MVVDLKRVVTDAYARAMFKMSMKTSTSGTALALSTLLGMPLGPAAFYAFIHLRVEHMSAFERQIIR